MLRCVPVLAVCLIAAHVSCGQDGETQNNGITLPALVQLQAGRMSKVAVTTSGKVVKWMNMNPEQLDMIPSESGRSVVVSAITPGTYRIAAWTAIGGEPTDAAICTIKVTGNAPTPTPPGPTPEPPNPQPPGPTPPNPAPPTKAWLVVIEDTAAASADRGKMFQDPALQSYIKSKGWKVRIADKNVLGPDGKPPADLAPYLKRAQGKQLPQMYLVDQDGEVRIEGAVPSTTQELLDLLKKVGG